MWARTRWGTRPFQESACPVPYRSGARRTRRTILSRKGYELTDTVTLTQGRHTIKAGGRARQITSRATRLRISTAVFVQSARQHPGLPCRVRQSTRSIFTGKRLLRLTNNQDAEGCGPTQFTITQGSPCRMPPARYRNVRAGRLALPAEPDHQHRSEVRDQNNIHDLTTGLPGSALRGLRREERPGIEDRSAGGLGDLLRPVLRKLCASGAAADGYTQQTYQLTAGAGTRCRYSIRTSFRFAAGIDREDAEHLTIDPSVRAPY